MTSGMTDWHSHILFGVDDGVETLDDSLEILDAYAAMGFSRVWLTPHIMEDVPNTPDGLRRRFAELKNAYSGPIELRLAAENMIDPLFEKRLADGDLLPIGERGDHLLTEIKSKGFFPVLAHPERYRYMDERDYRWLKENDIKFQSNLFSLLGIYGPEAARKADWLLRQGMTDMLGSDIPRPSMLRFFDDRLPGGKTLKAFTSLSRPNNSPT